MHHFKPNRAASLPHSCSWGFNIIYVIICFFLWLSEENPHYSRCFLCTEKQINPPQQPINRCLSLNAGSRQWNQPA